MKKIYTLLNYASIFLLLLFFKPVFAQQLIQDRFAFEPNLSYDQNIPSPASELGYRLGERFTDYPDMLDYFEKLAAASPKISIGTYGATYEKRKLIYLVITSEENQNNLETIRENNLKLSNPLKTTQEEANAIQQNHPVIVSFSYNIHGNEASGTEAAMQVAYRLVAAQDAATQGLLQNTVFIMMPCINPDGRERFVSFANAMQRKHAGLPQTELIHNEPFPNGRTNHYWFDLNRDWIWLVHRESRGHISLYQQWMPQVHVDYHEQGHNANYYTSPGTTPSNLLIPDGNRELMDTFGRANIAAFNQHQINYFTRERFDFFYPGYGSSYPATMGAIGMLTEQGSSRGFAIETDDGYILTLLQGIFDHYTTSMATLKKAAGRKDDLFAYYRKALSPQLSKSKIKTYIFPDEPNSYLYEVLQILLSHGVDVEQVQSSFSTKNIQSYQQKNIANKTFPKGTFIVSTNQPKHVFINSILSPNLEIEDSVMYDMSTWAAPLAYNLDAYYTNSKISANSMRIDKIPQKIYGVFPKIAQYAYTLEWKQTNAPKALSMLWKKGYRVRVAKKPFGNNEKAWSEGTLIILCGRNRAKANTIAADMEAIAKECQVIIDGHQTGRMEKGIDLASTDAQPIKMPKVAMLVEPPFSTYTSGQIYFLFDQVTGLPVDRIRTTMLAETDIPKFGRRNGSANLNDYDVLILPGASAENLKKVFGKKGVEKLKVWVSQGGTLIGTEGAAAFLTKEKSGLTDVPIAEVKKDSSKTAKYLAYKDRTDYFGKKRIPGAALQAKIDNTNPLAFGMPTALYSLKFGTIALKPNPSFETVGYYLPEAKDLLASGYVSKVNLNHLAGKAFAGVKNIGKGKVVFLLDNTQYRMFWRGPSRMMQNAVMLLKEN